MTDANDQSDNGGSDESSMNDKDTVRPATGPSEALRVAIPRPSELRPLNALSSTPPPVEAGDFELEESANAYLVDDELLDDETRHGTPSLPSVPHESAPHQSRPQPSDPPTKPAPLGVRSRFSTAPPKQSLAARSSAPAQRPTLPPPEASDAPGHDPTNGDNTSGERTSRPVSASPSSSLPPPKSRPSGSFPPPKSRPSGSFPPPKSRPSGSLPPKPSVPPPSLTPRASVQAPGTATASAPPAAPSLFPRVPLPSQSMARSALIAKRLTPSLVSKQSGLAHSAGPPSSSVGPLSSHPPGAETPLECRSATRLNETGRTQAWLARAAALESHANTQKDATKKARTLVLVSELYALAGRVVAAKVTAERASKLGSHLAQRQLRQLAQVAGDDKAASAHFVLEASSAVTPETRRHTLLAHAAYERWVRKDALASARILDQVARLVLGDPLPRLAKLANQLGNDLAPPAAAGAGETEPVEITRALHTLQRLRGDSKPRTDAVSDPVASFLEVRRALERHDRVAAATAVLELQTQAGFERAAPWLAAALLAPLPSTRKRAVELLTALSEQRSTRAVRRTLLARSLESGDNEAVADALRADEAREPLERAFTSADQLALGALCHTASEATLDEAARLELSDDDRALLAAAALNTGRPDLVESLGQHSTALLVASHEGRVASLTDLVDAEAPTPDLVRFLQWDTTTPSTDQEAAESHAGNANLPTPDELLSVPGLVGNDNLSQLVFTTAVLAETRGEFTKAQELFSRATADDASGEASLRALLRTREPEEASRLLEDFAQHQADPDRRAESLVHAALASTEPTRQADLVLRAHAAAPDHVLVEAAVLRFMPRLTTLWQAVESIPPPSSSEGVPAPASLSSKRLAILSHQSVTGDSDYMRALGLLRHVLTKPSAATRTTLLSHAWDLWPKDAALLDLRERFGELPLDVRAKAREALAASVQGPRSVAILETEAALFYELAAMSSSSARVAHRGDLGPLLLEDCFGRNAPGTEFAAAWRQRVIERAHSAEHSTERAYHWLQVARLAADAGDWTAERDAVGRAIHLDPTNVEALLSAEALAFKDGEVERVAEVERYLSEALDTPDHLAHAQMASRFLQLSAGGSAGYASLCACANDSQTPPEVARRLAYQAPRMGDEELGYRMYRLLLATTTRTPDKVSLLTRCAELALRLGKTGTALTHLDDAISLQPTVTALSLRAEILAEGGYHAAAAEAYERLAHVAVSPLLRAAAYKRATAQLELERAPGHEGLSPTANPPVADPKRLRLNLERALEASPEDEEVLEKLVGLYAQHGLDGELSELFVQRLESAAGDRRQQLLLRWSAACTVMGSTDRAFQLVREVLQHNPDSAGALKQLATLTKDTAEREQTLLQLIRVSPAAAGQATAYKHLGDFYRDESHQPARAIKCYQEALRRKPDDHETFRALVEMQVESGDTTAAEATIDAFAQRAVSDAERRAVAIARAATAAVTDPDSAEAQLHELLLDRPYDNVVLDVLAQTYVRAGNLDKLRQLNDRVRQQAERELPNGEYVAQYVSALASLAQLRTDGSALALVTALSNLYHGIPSGLDARGSRALSVALDQDLAPPPLSEDLRTLLARTSEALEEAFPLNIADLNPVALKEPRLVASFEMKAKAVGIGAPALFVVSSAPYLCQVTHHPARVYLGAGWVEHAAASLQDFIVWRCLKLLQARVGTLAHLSPEAFALRLDALVSAYTNPGDTLVPDTSGENRLRDLLHPLLPKDSDLSALAKTSLEDLAQSELEVGDAIALWVDRAAMLATGEPRVALLAICAMHGETGITSKAALLEAIARQPSARRLLASLLNPTFIDAHRSIH